MDVTNFFGSIEPATLSKEVGLSNRVIECVVSPFAYDISIDTSRLNASRQCRMGITEGSLCSPLIAALVIARVLRSCDIKSVVSYADNVCLLAKSEGDLRAQKQALIAAFKGSTFGTLRVHSMPEGARATGIDFLGYQVRYVDNEIEIEPADDAVSKIGKKLFDLAKETRRPGKSRKDVHQVLALRLERWCQGYKLTNIFRSFYMLSRFAEYISYKPIKNANHLEVGGRFDRWNERLNRALSERAPLGLRQPILHERGIYT